MDGIGIGILGVLLLLAAGLDIRSHRIPNALILTGLILAAAYGAWRAGLSGLLYASGGMVAGCWPFCRFICCTRWARVT